MLLVTRTEPRALRTSAQCHLAPQLSNHQVEAARFSPSPCVATQEPQAAYAVPTGPDASSPPSWRSSTVLVATLPRRLLPPAPSAAPGSPVSSILMPTGRAVNSQQA